MSEFSQATKLNKDPDPIFDEPIPADAARRKLDRKLLESYDADHDRIRAMSSRLTRIEVVFENVQRDLARLEQRQTEMLAHLEHTASSMAGISNKLSVHTDLEEFQWSVVNKSNDTLAEVMAELNKHLKESAVTDVRINWNERLLFLLYGGLGSIVMGLVINYFVTRL